MLLLYSGDGGPFQKLRPEVFVPIGDDIQAKDVAVDIRPRNGMCDRFHVLNVC